MINLLPVERVITFIAVAYAAFTCLFFFIAYDNDTSFLTAISFATGGSTFLHIFLLGMIYLGWEKLWS